MSGAAPTNRAALLAHPRIARIAARLSARPGVRLPMDDAARRAAVALILRAPAVGGDVEFLLIRRAEYPTDPWSGHVALPGGRREPGDASLEQTAMRETLEETAIDLARTGVLLGTLDELQPRSPVIPPIVVRPYVGVVPAGVTVEPSHEVAAAFWVPLEALHDPAASVEATVTARGAELVVPGFRLGDHIVWGLTERILRQFAGLGM